MHAARRPGAATGVHHDHVVEPGPGLHQPGGLPRLLPHVEGDWLVSEEPPGNLAPRAVVAAVRVADADEQARAGWTHSSRRSSFRKWVAQEMQGS